MAYGSSPVEVSAYVAVGDHCQINYLVFPRYNTVEFTLGGGEELVLNTTVAGLRHCIAVFTSALDAFTAAATAQSDATHTDLVPSADPPADHVG